MQIPWRFTGFLVQSGLVGAVLVVPMFYPEVIAVALPKIGITLQAPARQLAPEPAAASSAASAAPNPALRSAPKRYIAPSRWDRPAAAIVDEPGAFFPAVGSGEARADTSLGVSTLGTLPPPVVETKPQTPPPPAEPAPKRITVGGSVQAARLVRQVTPVYPPLAKNARISGTVRLEAVIGPDGTVEQLRAVSGHPLLTKAALDAVREWRYQATLLNGRAVEVATVIDVNFVLGGR
jgi:protein TonB